MKPRYLINVTIPSYIEDIDTDLLQDEMVQAMERVLFDEHGVLAWDDIAFKVGTENGHKGDSWT